MDAVVQAERTIGIHYVIAAPFGVIDVETSATQYSANYLQENLFTCANHICSSELKHLGIGIPSSGTFIREGRMMQLLRSLERHATNDAERFIWAHMIQDHARHLTYGYDHLKYAVTHQEGEAGILQTLLTIGEAMMGTELNDSVLRSAAAIVFGGGIEGGRQEGMATYLNMVGDFVRDYLALCEWLGVPRTERLHPNLKKYLEF